MSFNLDTFHSTPEDNTNLRGAETTYDDHIKQLLEQGQRVRRGDFIPPPLPVKQTDVVRIPGMNPTRALLTGTEIVKQKPLDAVLPSVPKQDSAICETAVAISVAAGLSPALAPAAYQLCKEYLPVLVSKGATSASGLAKQLGNYVMGKLKGSKKGGMKGKATKSGLQVGTVLDIFPRAGPSNQRVAAPVSVTRKIQRRNKPVTRNLKNGTIIVSHTEMIGVLVTGTPASNITPYTTKTFRINPGVSSLFPWLSTLAVNYDKYRFRKLQVALIPLVSTAFNGRVGIGYDPDSTDAVPANRSEFFALAQHAENAPWLECATSVPCDNQLRFTGTHSVTDSKLIDLGQIIAFSDQISSTAAAIAVADIVVSYDVELHMPQQALQSSQSFTRTTVLPTGVYNLGNALDSTVIQGISLVNVRKTTAAQLTFTMPPGAYTVNVLIQWSTGTPASTVGGLAVGNGSFLADNAAAHYTGAVLTYSSNSDITVTLTWTGVDLETNLTKFNLVFTRVSPSVTSALV